MATKSIGELTQDEFLRILGPDQGSSRDGSRVAVGRSTRDSCVNVVDGKLQVNGSDEFRRTVEAAYEAKKTPSSGFGSAPYRPEPKPEPEPTLSKLMPKTQEPVIEEFDVGYYWNEHHQSKDAIYKKLYGPEANFQQQSMFERNNEHLQDMVLPGELVILANEPKTLAEKDRLILLKTQAKEASEGIQQLTPEEATTVHRHFALLDTIAAQDLSTPSAAFGIISTVVAKRLNDLNAILGEINTLHVAYAGASKGSRSLPPEFYIQRQILFGQLDNALNKLTLTGVKIPESAKIKHRLGLSTKSIIHNWRTVSRHGEVSALGSRMNHISKLAKGAGRLGILSIALDGATFASRSYVACTSGNTCEQTTVQEFGRFSGGVIVGSAGAVVGATSATVVASGIAIGLGVTLAAPVVSLVALVGAGAGGYLAGGIGGDIGAKELPNIYEQGKSKAAEIIREVKIIWGN